MPPKKAVNITSKCLCRPPTKLRFSGQWEGGKIQLVWQTADETNISYYTVERSTDGIVFTPVAQVTAAGGLRNNYTATDAHVPSGIIYYRLQITGRSGFANYSQNIVFNKMNTQSFSVYPTLITGNIPVKVTYPGTNGPAYIRMVGVDGKVCRIIAVPAGSTQTSIDVTGLASGSYIVVFTGKDTVTASQIWKQ